MRSSRAAYTGLARKQPVPWQGRAGSVRAATCVVTRAGFRGRGVAYALARAAVDLARSLGARAIECYPMLTKPGQRISWDEIRR